MILYAFLRRHLPEPLAQLLTGLWFAILILLVLFFAFEPQASFRYGNI